ncbi:MAG: CoA transferase subunit A [Deltaproteobacteria bacterium]|nr:CoA transferase subunit A [Deltaproteobacteria bacterium]
MNKVVSSALEAVKPIVDGSTILVGGFGLCGIPENLIRALREQGAKDLAIVSNNCGIDTEGLGILLSNGQVKKMVSSYVGENKFFENAFLGGDLEVELVPQGTLAERLRAGGSGIAAFFTATGYGTGVSEGGIPMLYDNEGVIIKASPAKETRQFSGRGYVLEEAIEGDYAFVKAYQGDRFGNLVYRKTARNFNPMIAAAGKITIAEVEHLVEPGEIPPDHVHTPGVHVNFIFQGERYDKPIEQRTVRPRDAAQA